MAVEVESAGQLQEVLRILRKRSWWIAIPAIVILAAGTAIAVIIPKKFVCSTTIVVRNPFSDLPQFESQGVGEAQIAAHQIRSGDRISQVLHDLGWRDFASLPPSLTGDYIRKLATNLTVTLPPAARGDTKQIVTIRFQHTSPRRCFDFVTRMSEVWREEILDRDRQAHVDAYETLLDDRDKAQRRREDIGEEVAKLRKEFGVEAPVNLRGNFMTTTDPLYAQRAEDDIKLAELQDRIGTLLAKIEKDEERFAKMPPMVSKSLTEGGVDHEERIRANQQELKELRAEQKRYLKEHSKYRRLQRKIVELQKEIALLEQGELDPVSRQEEIPNKDRLELGDEIEKTKDALALARLNLTSVRKRMADWDGRIAERVEAERRIRALEEEKGDVNAGLEELNREIAKSRMAQDLRQSPAGNPFEVLDSPRRPNRPTEPDPLLIVLFSLFAGLGLGLGLAVLVEYNRSSFRSVADVSRVMVVPVLGTINTIRTDRERLRIRTTRTVVGGVTFVFVASLAFVTWAWAERPQLLSSPLRDAIEELRESLE